MASSDDDIPSTSATLVVYDGYTAVTEVVYVESVDNAFWVTSIDAITSSIRSEDVMADCIEGEIGGQPAASCTVLSGSEGGFLMIYDLPESTPISESSNAGTIQASDQTSNDASNTITIKLPSSSSTDTISLTIPDITFSTTTISTFLSTSSIIAQSNSSLMNTTRTVSTPNIVSTTVVCPNTSDRCATTVNATHGHSTAAAIAGMVVGSIIALVLLFAIIFLAFRYGRKKGEQSQHMEQPHVNTHPPSYPETETETKAADRNAAEPSELPSIQVSTTEPAASTVVSPLSSSNLAPDHRPWSPSSFSSVVSHATSMQGMHPEREVVQSATNAELDPDVHQIHELDAPNSGLKYEKSFTVYQ